MGSGTHAVLLLFAACARPRQCLSIPRAPQLYSSQPHNRTHLQPCPALLLFLSGGTFDIGDRVASLSGTGTPPFGARGTVVGIIDDALEVGGTVGGTAAVLWVVLQWYCGWYWVVLR